MANERPSQAGGRILPLEPKRKREIGTRAEDLALYYTRGGRVNVEQVARDEGIRFHYESFPENFDGCIGPSGDHFLLVCNTRRAPRHSPRSRYTFAHELGHYFIPEHRAKLLAGAWPLSLCLTETTTSQPEEREADWFAANLLLPEQAVRTAFEFTTGTALGHADILSRHFRVSVSACAFRLLGLGLLPAPAAVCRWTRDGKPAGRQMSDETAALAPRYRKLTLSPPDRSVTAAAVVNCARGRHYGRTPAMAWFPGLSGYDRGDDAFLHEEVMSLHDHGFLTMLYTEPSEITAD